METLKNLLQQVLSGYAGEALNGYSYLTSDAANNIFTVVSVGDVRGQRVVDTGLVVRVLPDQIVIERDVNDKPLVEALVQAGIPRHQIVLAYSGEAASQK